MWFLIMVASHLADPTDSVATILIPYDSQQTCEQAMRNTRVYANSRTDLHLNVRCNKIQQN